MCFIRNKYHNHTVSVITSTILEIYGEEKTIVAKQTLLQTMSDKSLIAGLQQFAKRCIVKNKIKTTV